MTASITAAPTATEAEADARAAKDLELTRRFGLAMIADPTLLDEVPDGVLLELLPDDDAEHVEVALARGIEAARAGRNVYFRHVRTAGLPE